MFVCVLMILWHALFRFSTFVCHRLRDDCRSPHLYTAKPNVSRSVKDMNLMNAFSTPWLNLSIGITMGYSLDQLPAGKRRERLPTEPGPGVATSTWDPSSATPSTSNACSVSASVSSVNNSMGGYASPSSASPIKSPPLHHHIDIGDELDPHKSKNCFYFIYLPKCIFLQSYKV